MSLLLVLYFFQCSSSDDSNTNFTDYPTSTISSNTPEHSLGNTRNTSSSSNWEATPTSEEDEKEYDVHVDVVTMDTNSCRPSRGLSITDSGLGLSHSSDSDKCFLPSSKSHYFNRNTCGFTNICSLLDPRNWTRVHVLQWVCAMSKELNVNLDAKQFYMNGMGLSLISQDGFIRRTGSSAKGTFMFKDIKSRYNNS